MKTNIIYVYTTQTDRSKNQFKVGETSNSNPEKAEAKAKKRIKEQKTGNSEKLEMIQYWETDMSDHELRDKLFQKGYIHIKGGGSEWVQSPNGLDELLKDINDILLGVRAKDSYKMRREQEECVSMASDFFLKAPIESKAKFLIDAKMRFGKTFTSFNIVKKMGFKNILVLTYTPYVKNEWINPIKNHIDFAGWNIVDAINSTKSNPIELLDKENVNVLFTSAQDILQMDSKDKWNKVREKEWDIILFDEFDFGGLTQKSLELLEKLKSNRLLAMTGTAFKVLNNNYFDKNAIYTWSYEDEQKAKKNEKNNSPTSEVYKWLPDMEFRIFELGDKAQSKATYYDSQGQFSFAKFFEVKSNKFIYDAAVDSFLEHIFGETHDHFSPFKTLNLKHTFWLVPSVEATKVLKNKIQDQYGSEYEVIAVSGDAEDSNESEKNIVKLVNNKLNKKTITLSVQKHTRGITVPRWDAVFFLKNIESPQEYFQAAFRCQSSNKEEAKEKCYVVDFDFNRVIRICYERSLIRTDYKTDAAKKDLEFFFSCAPVIGYQGNKFKAYNFSTLWEAAKKDFKFTRIFSESYLYSVMNFTRLNSHSSSVLLELGKQIGKSSLSSGGYSSEEILELNEKQSKNKGSDKKEPDEKQTAKEKEDQETFNKLKEIAKDIIKDLAKYILITPESETNLDDVLNGDEETFKMVANISLKDLKKMVESGFIDRNKLNEAILGFHEEESDI